MAPGMAAAALRPVGGAQTARRRRVPPPARCAYPPPPLGAPGAACAVLWDLDNVPFWRRAGAYRDAERAARAHLAAFRAAGTALALAPPSASERDGAVRVARRALHAPCADAAAAAAFVEVHVALNAATEAACPPGLLTAVLQREHGAHAHIVSAARRDAADRALLAVAAHFCLRVRRWRGKGDAHGTVLLAVTRDSALRASLARLAARFDNTRLLAVGTDARDVGAHLTWTPSAAERWAAAASAEHVTRRPPKGAGVRRVRRDALEERKRLLQNVAVAKPRWAARGTTAKAPRRNRRVLVPGAAARPSPPRAPPADSDAALEAEVVALLQRHGGKVEQDRLKSLLLLERKRRGVADDLPPLDSASLLAATRAVAHDASQARGGAGSSRRARRLKRGVWYLRT